MAPPLYTTTGSAERQASLAAGMRAIDGHDPHGVSAACEALAELGVSAQQALQAAEAEIASEIDGFANRRALTDALRVVGGGRLKLLTASGARSACRRRSRSRSRTGGSSERKSIV